MQPQHISSYTFPDVRNLLSLICTLLFFIRCKCISPHSGLATHWLWKWRTWNNWIQPRSVFALHYALQRIICKIKYCTWASNCSTIWVFILILLKSKTGIFRWEKLLSIISGVFKYKFTLNLVAVQFFDILTFLA